MTKFKIGAYLIPKEECEEWNFPIKITRVTKTTYHYKVFVYGEWEPRTRSDYDCIELIESQYDQCLNDVFLNDLQETIK